MTFNKYLTFAWAMLSLAALTGCGQDIYKKAVVTGKVMCGDKPAWGALITFQPIDAPDKTGRPQGNPGGVSRAIVQEDGTFRLEYEARGAEGPEEGAVIGPHHVSISPPVTEPLKWDPQDDWLPEEDKARLKKELAEQKIYPKLECGAEIEPAQVEVQPGTNSFDFKLVGTPAKRPQPVQPMGSD